MADTADLYVERTLKSTAPSDDGDSTTTDGIAAAWNHNSERLAAWACERLVNRADAWGKYFPGGKAITDTKTEVTIPRLVDHFRGVCIRGLHAIGLDTTSKWCGLDIDAHGEKSEEQIAANEAYAIERFNVLRAAGFNPLLESNRRGGYHVWWLFDRPIPSALAYRFCLWLIRDFQSFGVSKPESRPLRADRHTRLGFGGNYLRLPGRHHKRDEWAKVFDGTTWLEGEAACRYILSLEGDDPDLIPPDVSAYRTAEELKAEKQKLEADAREIERKRLKRLDRLPEITSQDRYAIAQRIVDDHEAAIEGQNGSKVAYRLACLLTRGCELSVSEAVGLMLNSSWNARCVPPWPENELLHKCEDASKEGGPSGYKLHHKRREPLRIIPLEVPSQETAIGIKKYHELLNEAVMSRRGKRAVHLLKGPPGCGKTTTIRKMVKLELEAGVRSLTLLPTHTNLKQELANYRRELPETVNVQVTPKRVSGAENDPKANCWNDLADCSEKMGLPPVATVCGRCQFRERCEAGGYLEKLNKAKQADVLLATHKRAEAMGLVDLAGDRKLIVIDEDSRQLLKPLDTASRKSVRLALKDLEEALDDGFVLNSGWLNVTKDDGEQAIKQKADLEAFLRQSLVTVKWLVEQIDAATTTQELTVPLSAWSGGSVPRKLMAFVFHVLSKGRKWPGKKSPWPVLARILTGGTAYVAEHRVWKDKTADQPAQEVMKRSLVCVRKNPLPTDAAVWILDGTGNREDLEALIGQPVEDATPKSSIKRVHRAVQYHDDISRSTQTETVLSIVRGYLAANPQIQELGIICHDNDPKPLKDGTPQKSHFEAIEDLKQQDPRLKMVTYFGHGSERASNEWNQQCDALLVLGTMRPGPHAVQLELLRRGDVTKAAMSPPWESFLFETTDEAGMPHMVGGRGYRDPTWQKAFVSICRTEMVQAISRARIELQDGIPVGIFSNEPLGYPMSVGTPERLKSKADHLLTILRDHSRESANPSKVNSIRQNGRFSASTLRTGVLALMLGKVLGENVPVRTVNRILTELAPRGLVIHHGKAGWRAVIDPQLAETPKTPTPQPVIEETTAPNAPESTQKPLGEEYVVRTSDGLLLPLQAICEELGVSTDPDHSKQPCKVVYHRGIAVLADCDDRVFTLIDDSFSKPGQAKPLACYARKGWIELLWADQKQHPDFVEAEGDTWNAFNRSVADPRPINAY